MSISVAVIQRKDRINRDNTAPLFIRVTIDKKRHLEAVGVSIPLSAWDKNASRIHEKYLEGRSIQLKIDARVEEIWRKIKRLEALDKEDKSSYIDNFLDRAANVEELSLGLNRALRGENPYSWFIQ